MYIKFDSKKSSNILTI